MKVIVLDKFNKEIHIEIFQNNHSIPRKGDSVLLDASKYSKNVELDVCIYHEVRKVNWNLYTDEVVLYVWSIDN